MSKLYVSAGHGGKDPGAVVNGVMEKNLNLEIASKVLDLLKRDGYDTLTNRVTDVDSTIADKVKQANLAKVSALIEVHLNAGGGQGCEVYHSRVGGNGLKLAQAICDNIHMLGFSNRGPKVKLNDKGTDYFGIIRDTNMPTVLVECCFLDSKEDMDRLNTDLMARAIVKGISQVYPAPVAIAPKPTAIMVGDVVYFEGGSHYVNARASAPAARGLAAGIARVTAVAIGSHPYHLIGLGKTKVYGWVDPSQVSPTAPGTPVAPTNPKAFKVGDTVQFAGGKHYTSATGSTSAGGTRTAGKAKITNINKKGKHPYHLVGSGKCNVYGWVDGDKIK